MQLAVNTAAVCFVDSCDQNTWKHLLIEGASHEISNGKAVLIHDHLQRVLHARNPLMMSIVSPLKTLPLTLKPNHLQGLSAHQGCISNGQAALIRDHLQRALGARNPLFLFKPLKPCP